VGGITINEWRKKQGLPPVPWGDVWWAPVNKAAVVDGDSTPQGDTSPTTLPDDEGQAPAAEAAVDKSEVVSDDEARALLRAFDPPEEDSP